MSLETIKQNVQSLIDSIYSFNSSKDPKGKEKSKKYMKTLLDEIKKETEEEREKYNAGK
ncbi:MAG: hypothetical protein U9Q69_00970 [Nanoarchaeota archaeon]|nr:hypothetical protein [Nanoarchaeota archaeon]